MNCRPRYGGLEALTRGELKRVIEEARLSRLEADIADLYYGERMAQVEVSAALDYSRSTISRRLPDLSQRLEYTARKIGLIS